MQIIFSRKFISLDKWLPLCYQIGHLRVEENACVFAYFLFVSTDFRMRTETESNRTSLLHDLEHFTL